MAERDRCLKVLFLCTGNSCRSQMAEGWAKFLKSAEVEAYSAGTECHGMNPIAVRVMHEAGVDISSHQSKTVSAVKDIEFDYVVTVCSDADRNCPVFSGRAVKIHYGFDDPPRLAKGARSEAEALSIYRRVRDDIRRFVETFPGALSKD